MSDLPQAENKPVPPEVSNPGDLPPLTYRDLPRPIPLRAMIGPGVILAGLSLGSGEFVIWPYVTSQTQFVFFWACIIGVTTQYFINMEIARWTLATGESALTGFARLSRHWAWVFLIANIVPHMIPAWARGASEIMGWLIFEPELATNENGNYFLQGERYVDPLTIGSMVLCGLVLTAGPVLYSTVEKIQMVLVGLVMVLVLILAISLIRVDAITAQLYALVTFGDFKFLPEMRGEIDPMLLLGALAFAGAGGTLNLGESNYVKDKGYAMGKYIGRITSPITGQKEPVSEVGFLPLPGEENRSRWRTWWRRTNQEHFLTFWLPCVFCLFMLSLISYSLFYDADGQMKPGMEKFPNDLTFIFGEAREIQANFGGASKLAFLVMGVAILLTTELAVLDVCTRISTDIVKVNWLRNSEFWSEGRLYYLFLWLMIASGAMVLVLQAYGVDVGAFALFKLVAALNGGVMFLYSATLLVLNCRRLPPELRMSWPRLLIMAWAVLFFGFFCCWAIWHGISVISGSSA